MDAYYSRLNEFQSLAKSLIEKGLPYMSIVASNELYRHLQNYDRFIKNEDRFDSKDPVLNITLVIDKLIDLLNKTEEVFSPYDLKLVDRKSESVQDETAKVYHSLWEKFDEYVMIEESLKLIKLQFTDQVDRSLVEGKKVLDMGCGSGRYSFALSQLNAQEVIGFDIGGLSLDIAESYVKEKNINNISFTRGDYHHLPFEDKEFDFVYANGTFHHSTSIDAGLKELKRVLKDDGSAWIYLYGKGGIHWDTRLAIREIMKNVPMEYSHKVFELMGVPGDQFGFLDVSYVPIETYSSKEEVEELFSSNGFDFKKVIPQRPYDLDYCLTLDIPNKEKMWGCGEHRYLLKKLN